MWQGIIYSLLDRKNEAEERFETYKSLVPEEFPQRGFLDDVVLAAKTESQEQFQEEFETEFSYRKWSNSFSYVVLHCLMFLARMLLPIVNIISGMGNLWTN